MFSADNNLQNHLSKNEIELLREVGLNEYVEVTQCSKKEYDLIQTKDPNKVYITEKGNFLGETKIEGTFSLDVPKSKIKYLLSFNGNKYVIYYNYIFKLDNTKNGEKYASLLYEICTIDDPNKAISMLNTFNKIGHHDDVSMNIYETINNFFNQDIFINDFTIGIISMIKGKEDPRLQEIINLAISYKANEGKTSLSKEFRAELEFLKDECKREKKDSFIPLYTDISFYATQYFIQYKSWDSQIRKDEIKKKFLEYILRLYKNC